MNEFVPTFTFKRFAVDDRRCAMKVGTDGVILGAWASMAVDGKSHVADIGAGSGLIAMMIAQRYPQAVIEAVEINNDAYADLCRNVAESPFNSRIKTICGDYLILDGTYDLIVSNPPFFAPGVSSPEAARCQARVAGDLSPVALIAYAAGHLSAAGRLAMIAPSTSDSEIEYHAALNRLNVCRRVSVVTSKRRGVTRTLWELTKASCAQPDPGFLVVGSDEYKALTSAFYL